VPEGDVTPFIVVESLAELPERLTVK
jgi:hypothetical protein